MADSAGVLPAKTSDLWIGGLRAAAHTTQISATFSPTVVDVTALGSAVGQTHKDALEGNLTLALLYKPDAHQDHIMRLWDSALAGAAAVPVVMAHGDRIRIGEVVSILCVQPTDMSIDTTAKDVIRVNLTATWDGAAVTGALKSTQTATGNLPMVSTESTDFGLQAITNRGAPTRTRPP